MTEDLNTLPKLPVSPGEPLRDQRVTYFANTDVTVEQVSLAWEAHRTKLLQSGYRAFPERMGEKETLDWLDVPDELIAHVGTGRWIAVCPYCNGGISVWNENPQAVCLDCGRRYSNIKWPEDLERGVEALTARPDRLLRFWNPEVETAEDLEKENEANGV